MDDATRRQLISEVLDSAWENEAATHGFHEASARLKAGAWRAYFDGSEAEAAGISWDEAEAIVEDLLTH